MYYAIKISFIHLFNHSFFFPNLKSILTLTCSIFFPLEHFSSLLFSSIYKQLCEDSHPEHRASNCTAGCYLNIPQQADIAGSRALHLQDARLSVGGMSDCPL